MTIRSISIGQPKSTGIRTIGIGGTDPIERPPEVAESGRNGFLEDFVKPAAESTLRIGGALAGGLVAFPVAGLVGLDKLLTNEAKLGRGGLGPASQAVEDIASLPMKLIKTPEQEKSMGYIMKPLEIIQESAKWWGDLVYKKTGNPDLAAIVSTGVEAATYLALPKLKAELLGHVKAGRIAEATALSKDLHRQRLEKLKAEPNRLGKLVEAERGVKLKEAVKPEPIRSVEIKPTEAPKAAVKEPLERYFKPKPKPEQKALPLPPKKPSILKSEKGSVELDFEPLVKTVKDIQKRWKDKGVRLYITEKEFKDGYGETRKVITLHDIVVPKNKRKEGVGSRVMEDLTRYADRTKQNIELTAAQKDDFHGTTSKTRLVKFYKRFGFVQNKGRNKDFTTTQTMYRKPKTYISTAKKIIKSESGQVTLDFEPLARAAKVVGKDVKDLAADARKMADEYLGPISTRLGNIHPTLKNEMRRFELRSGTRRIETTKKALPFLEKVKRMRKEDKNRFDMARKNGNAKALQSLIIKYNMGKEYSAVRKILNDAYRDAKDVGYDVKYREHYHPRVLKDQKGFLEYMYKQKDWPILERAIREREVKLGRYLDADEKAQLINTMLRGYRSGNITLSKPGQLKARQIETVWPELNKFYMDSDAALVKYISSVSEAIEARRVFGKKAKGEKVQIGEMNNTIGGYVLKLLEEKKIKPEQEQVLRDILSARFNEVGTRGIVSFYKNVSYADTMGSPKSAITQFGDLAWPLYRNGPWKTTKAASKAIIGKSKFKKEDIGIERIAEEFASNTKSAKMVSKIFKIIGLEKIDNIGKETMINSEYMNLVKKAKTEKGRIKLQKELSPTFGKETAQLIKDIQEGRITENVKLHLFNTLSDFQPISLSEMPQKYLTGGNGRIFYMLKTFTIKQFDIYRREVFQKIAKPGTRLEGIRNLVRLSACFVAANAGADVIKDLLLGRPIILEDKVVDNLLRLFGISKFVTWKAREEGVGSAMVRQIAPPFKLADALSKDIMSAGDEKGMETPASIPVGGALYYWWFGKGKGKSERRKKKGKGKLATPGGLGSL